MWTLCAICTRLSIFVPSPMTVSPKAPRSIVTAGADFHFVLHDHAAELRNLDVALARCWRSRIPAGRSARRAGSAPGRPDRHGRSYTLLPISQSRPIATPRPMTVSGPMRVPVADLGMGSDHDAGTQHDALADLGARIDRRALSRPVVERSPRDRTARRRRQRRAAPMRRGSSPDARGAASGFAVLAGTKQNPAAVCENSAATPIAGKERQVRGDRAGQACQVVDHGGAVGALRHGDDAPSRKSAASVKGPRLS